jgi:hypothetical protein
MHSIFKQFSLNSVKFYLDVYSIDNSKYVYGTLLFRSFLSRFQLVVIQTVILFFATQKSRLCLFILEINNYFLLFVVTGNPSIHSNQGLQWRFHLISLCIQHIIIIVGKYILRAWGGF